MRLSELHSAVEFGVGCDLPEEQAFAVLVAIEHLARVEGLPVKALDLSAPLFALKYTPQLTAFNGYWAGQRQYRTWRNLILDTQMRFAPGDVDANPWLSLDRAELLKNERSTKTLASFRKFLPAGTHPNEITSDLVIDIYKSLPLGAKKKFRASAALFRNFFKNELAIRSGLLPSEPPDRLPELHDHRQFSKMSPEIENWRARLTIRNDMNAIDYLNRLAVTSGLLNGQTDSLDDLRRAICNLPEPQGLDIPPIKKRTLQSYIASVRRKLGGPDPRKNATEQAWADLRTAARISGCETSYLWALGKPAAARDIPPWEITEAIAQQIIGSYGDSSMPAQCKRGCEQFDHLRGRVPDELLPPCPLGIKRHQRTPKKHRVITPKNLTEAAWADLYTRLRTKGWSTENLTELSYLRARSIAAGIAPYDLTVDFIDSLSIGAGKTSDRTRLRAAVNRLMTLPNIPDFSSFPALMPITDHRFTNGGLNIQLAAEFNDLTLFMNAAASTRRSFRASLCVLFNALGHPKASLDEILHANFSAADFGPHQSRREEHTKKLESLRRFVDLSWTPAWRALQKLTVGCGVTAKDNPVPKILSWNPGADPHGLTLEWAQNIDRKLRSTLTNPPHGRADLAITFARHLADFDTLHDIPEISKSGLLPRRFGAIRLSG